MSQARKSIIVVIVFNKMGKIDCVFVGRVLGLYSSWIECKLMDILKPCIVHLTVKMRLRLRIANSWKKIYDINK
ncbi:unnamed protein product [Sphenostylis stenocarpa]|uniref:Uncharacterized protein n=1 Tax=Sphenostylis stenocarpa TaxID=92480 RepID=A0AA86T2F2_9FABA|nr:unnamed protein product [Sphenostylis stenocarpa]